LVTIYYILSISVLNTIDTHYILPRLSHLFCNLEYVLLYLSAFQHTHASPCLVFSCANATRFFALCLASVLSVVVCFHVSYLVASLLFTGFCHFVFILQPHFSVVLLSFHEVVKCLQQHFLSPFMFLIRLTISHYLFFCMAPIPLSTEKKFAIVINQWCSRTNNSSAVAEMGDHLATIDMDRKLRGCSPLEEGELGPHLIQCHLGRSLPSGILIHSAVWPQ